MRCNLQASCLAGAFYCLPALALLVIVALTAAPVALLVLLPLVAIPGPLVFILLRVGGMHYLIANAGRVGVRPVPLPHLPAAVTGETPTEEMFRRRVVLSKIDVHLGGGDMVVVTDRSLLLRRRRLHAPAFEFAIAHARWADPEDWRRLQAWASAIWPHPPRHHRSAITP